MSLEFSAGIQGSMLFSLMWVGLTQSIKDLAGKEDGVRGSTEARLLDQGHQTAAPSSICIAFPLLLRVEGKNLTTPQAILASQLVGNRVQWEFSASIVF